MKFRYFLLLAILLTITAASAPAQSFAGEYADKKFLNNKGVFQMSLEQNEITCPYFFRLLTATGTAPRRKLMGRAK
jgi:hypothetical protein